MAETTVQRDVRLARMPREGRFAMKIDAGNDRNGNPRRGWIVYTTGGQLLGFVDEGYQGQGALRLAAPDAIELGTIPTTPRYYRDAIREWS